MKILILGIVLISVSCKSKQDVTNTVTPCSPAIFKDSFYGGSLLHQDPYAAVFRFRTKHIKYKLEYLQDYNVYTYYIYGWGADKECDTIKITCPVDISKPLKYNYIFDNGSSFTLNLIADDSALVRIDSLCFNLYRFINKNDSLNEVYYISDQYGLIKKYSGQLDHDYEIRQAICGKNYKYYNAAIDWLKQNPEFHIRLDPKARWLQYEVVDTALVRQQKLNEIEEAEAVKDLLLDQEKIEADSI